MCPAIAAGTVARDWPTLEAKAQRVADLPLRDALALLAEPGETEPPAYPPDPEPLGENPTEDELLTWIEMMDRRAEATDRAWAHQLEADQNRPKPDTAAGWLVYMREGDELLERAIRIKLEQQRDFVVLWDALSSLDAAPPADWRAEIAANTARYTGWLAELEADTPPV